MDRMEFRRKRRDLKVTQEELAQELGLPVHHINGVEGSADEVPDEWVSAVVRVAERRLSEAEVA